MDKPFLIERRKTGTDQISTTEYTSILGFHSSYPKGHYSKDTKKMFILSLDSKLEKRRDPTSEMAWNSPTKIQRRMGDKESGSFLQSPGSQIFMDISRESWYIMGRTLR